MSVCFVPYASRPQNPSVKIKNASTSGALSAT